MEKWRVANGKVKVLCTTPMIDDLVGRIGRERIDHLPLMGAATDPHSYELVKGDDEKFFVAQLIFYNGLGLEHTASLKTHLMKHSHAVALGDYIRSQNPTLILQNHGSIDPHVWLDVTLWEKTIDPIVSHLSLVDPEGKEFYEKQAIQIKQELFELDEWIQKQLNAIPSEKKYLVSSHDAFNYFARRYLAADGTEAWSERFCAPEGLAPDGQLGFQDLHRVINYLQKYQITVLFPESNVSQDSLKKILEICREKEIPMQMAASFLFSDTLTGSYEEMMKHNVKVLCEAWNQ